MDYIKQLLFTRFKIYSVITVSIVFSMTLLVIRMKLTHTFFYLFLVWNLFLAIIPFGITSYLVSLEKINKIRVVFWFGLWLVFLPNAPYIITDLLHLKISSHHLLWLDILVVSAFALNGLLLFFLSLMDMELILSKVIRNKYLKFLMVKILFLCGFGVYLGRFLRYNSWEIIQNPIELLGDILNIIFYPKLNLEAWLFTLLFGSFLYIGFWMFKQFKASE